VRHALFLAPLLLLTGCPTGPECGPQGGNCADGLVCANTHECLPASEVHRVGVHWTVLGQTASTSTCPDQNLELTIEQAGTENQMTYAPVPCATGVFTFTAIPTYFDAVEVFVPSSGETETATVGSGDVDVFVDLSSGNVLVDAAPSP
jgi:hypothetical protein